MSLVPFIKQKKKKGAGGRLGCPVGKKKRKEFVTPTETNLHGDARCFMVKTWARHSTTETVLNSGWRWAAVGGWRLVVGSGWRLAAGLWWRLAAEGGWPLVAVGGGWRLAAGGPWGLSSRAVLKKKKLEVLNDSPGGRGDGNTCRNLSTAPAGQ